MTGGWCLLYPAGIVPDWWIVNAPVPVVSVTTHPAAALILAGTGQVTGVILSHDWHQLDGLIRPFHDWHRPPPGDHRPRIRWLPEDPVGRRPQIRTSRVDRPRRLPEEETS